MQGMEEIIDIWKQSALDNNIPLFDMGSFSNNCITFTVNDKYEWAWILPTIDPDAGNYFNNWLQKKIRNE